MDIEIIDLLRKIQIFKGCTKEEIDLVAGLVSERQLKAGATIFSEQMPAEALYIVKTGYVRISMMAGEGEEVGLLLLGPGDFFGELALFQEETRLATARAESAADLLVFTRKDYHALLDLDPKAGARIAIAIAKLLAMRVRANSTRLREHLLE